MRFIQWIKQAFVSTVGNDASDYPRLQASYNEKVTDVVRLSPYGLETNPPKDVFCLLMQSSGQEAVKFAISSDFVNRKKELKEGEVALYNTLTETFVYLKEDGSVKIETEGSALEFDADGNVTCIAEKSIRLENNEGSFEVDEDGNILAENSNGEMLLEDDGTITLTGPDGTIDMQTDGTILIENSSGAIELQSSGVVDINGAQITLAGDVETALGISLDTHVHGGVQTGGGLTAVPQ